MASALLLALGRVPPRALHAKTFISLKPVVLQLALWERLRIARAHVSPATVYVTRPVALVPLQQTAIAAAC